MAQQAPSSAAIGAGAGKRRIGVHAGHDNYKWWALSCTSLGMLLATINSGTLIIALPDLERQPAHELARAHLGDPRYMIASTVLVLSAGRLSDQFGRKKAYIGGFPRVCGGVARRRLCRWRHRADHLADLCRGSAGAFLFANSAAIVTDAFPPAQLGVAMGTNTMVAAVGLVIGPVLGGALVDDLLALGVLVQRPVRGDRRQRVGVADPARS